MIPEQLLHEAYVMNMIQRIPNLAGEIVQQQKDLKIPDFDNVMITNLKKIGFKDPLPIILAEGKKHVWFIDIKNRKTVYPMKDAEKFEEAADFLRKKNKAKKVTGWLISNKILEKEAKLFLRKAGNLVTEVESIKLPVL